MSDDWPRFVQFPHPGGEHVPAMDEMPWNVGPHRRHFLISRGRYPDWRRRCRDDELVLSASGNHRHEPFAGGRDSFAVRACCTSPTGPGPPRRVPSRHRPLYLRV